MDSLGAEQERSRSTILNGAPMPILGQLLDLELPAAVAIGHANLAIKDVLKMKSGSVVPLNREAGEEVDLLVHGTVVARGEIVLVENNYAIRIKQMVDRVMPNDPATGGN